MTLSSATLSGTLKKDAEQRFTPNNNSVVTFMMNILRYDNKAKEEKSFPVKVNLWGDSFGDMLDRLKEGARVIVNGRIQIEQFNNREGKAVKLLCIEGNRLNFADELAQGSGAAMSSSSGSSDMEMDALPSEEIPF